MSPCPSFGDRDGVGPVAGAHVEQALPFERTCEFEHEVEFELLGDSTERGRAPARVAGRGDGGHRLLCSGPYSESRTLRTFVVRAATENGLPMNCVPASSTP